MEARPRNTSVSRVVASGDSSRMDSMTDTAPATTPQTPEEQFAYFHSRRELAVVQPQGSLALTTTQVIDAEQTVWGVPGRWAPRTDGGSGVLLTASASDGIEVDGETVDGTVEVRGKDDPNPSSIRFSDTVSGFVIAQEGGLYAVRIFDAQSEAIGAFGSIDAFPYDPSWVITADWSVNPEGTTLGFEHLKDDGQTREEVLPGRITFT